MASQHSTHSGTTDAEISRLREIAASDSVDACGAIQQLGANHARDPRTLPLFREIVTSGRRGADSAANALATVYGEDPETLALLRDVATSGRPGAGSAVYALATTYASDDRTLPLLRTVATSGKIGAGAAVHALVYMAGADPSTLLLIRDVAAWNRLGADAAVRALAYNYASDPGTMPLIRAIAASGTTGAASAVHVLHHLAPPSGKAAAAHVGAPAVPAVVHAATAAIKHTTAENSHLSLTQLPSSLSRFMNLFAAAQHRQTLPKAEASALASPEEALRISLLEMTDAEADHERDYLAAAAAGDEQRETLPWEPPTMSLAAFMSSTGSSEPSAVYSPPPNSETSVQLVSSVVGATASE